MTVNCLNFFTFFPVTQVVDVFNVSLFPYIFLILVSTFNLSSSWIPQNSLYNWTARDSFHCCNHLDHNHCISSKAWANVSEGGYLQLRPLRTTFFISVLNTLQCLMETTQVTLQVPVAKNNFCWSWGEHSGLVTQSFWSASNSCRDQLIIPRGPYSTVAKSFQAELCIILLWKFLRNKDNRFLQYRASTFYLPSNIVLYGERESLHSQSTCNQSGEQHCSFSTKIFLVSLMYKQMHCEGEVTASLLNIRTYSILFSVLT